MIEDKLDRMIELLEAILNKISYPCSCPPYNPWYPSYPYDPNQPVWTCTDNTHTYEGPECTAG